MAIPCVGESKNDERPNDCRTTHPHCLQPSVMSTHVSTDSDEIGYMYHNPGLESFRIPSVSYQVVKVLPGVHS